MARHEESDSPFTIRAPPSTIPAVSRRRRSRLKIITSLWPMGLALLLLAATVGFFWLVAREVRFERRALPVEAPVKK